MAVVVEEAEGEVLAEEAAEADRLHPAAAGAAAAAAAAAVAVAGPVRPAIVVVQPAGEVVSRHLMAAEGMRNHLTTLTAPTITIIPMAVTARTGMGILASVRSGGTTMAFHPARCIGPG